MQFLTACELSRHDTVPRAEPTASFLSRPQCATPSHIPQPHSACPASHDYMMLQMCVHMHIEAHTPVSSNLLFRLRVQACGVKSVPAPNT